MVCRVILSFQSQETLWPEITLAAKPRREPPTHIHHSHCLAAGNHTITRCDCNTFLKWKTFFENENIFFSRIRTYFAGKS